jgi:hypothetical protein
MWIITISELSINKFHTNKAIKRMKHRATKWDAINREEPLDFREELCDEQVDFASSAHMLHHSSSESHLLTAGKK